MRVLPHRTAVGEPYGVGRDDVAFRVAIDLLTQFDRLPCAVELVLLRARIVIDRFDVRIQHVAAGVGEGPGDVTVEADYDAGTAGQGDTRDVDLALDDEMRFVPDGGQRELEVGITRENGVAIFRPIGSYCPVVGSQFDVVLIRGAGREARGAVSRPRDRATLRPREERRGIRGSRRWQRCQAKTRSVGRRLNRFLDRAIDGNESFGRFVPYPRGDGQLRFRRVTIRQRLSHLGEQIRGVLRFPADRLHVEKAILERVAARLQVADPGVHASA
jgi:hypothetical protein